MRAIQYTDPDVDAPMQLVELEVPEPAPGEVRVRVMVSGVNPTDWKSRTQGTDAPKVPNQDGAGVVDAVGDGVEGLAVGDRVWLWEAAYGRLRGTAEEYVALPAAQAVPLGDASFDLGAALAIPAMTAHRALTAHRDGPRRLAPGALAGTAVLVTGGAGAVGHAAIQLARWAGATVIATVSSEAKAVLARAAGAHHVLDYTRDDVAAGVRAVVPDGVQTIVDVNAIANLASDLDALATGGTIAIYADDDGATLEVPVRRVMGLNARIEPLLVYTTSAGEKADAIAAIREAVADGALEVGEEHGLPLVRFPLERTGEAHRAVRDRTVGKVLVDVAAPPAG
jgi:NADPH:quinone reductase